MLSEADKARQLVKDDILFRYVQEIDKCTTVPHMVPATVKVVRELSTNLLPQHFMYLTNVQDPIYDILMAAKILQKAIETKK
jgi:hypothetical protein